jgi:hypothetical protein
LQGSSLQHPTNREPESHAYHLDPSRGQVTASFGRPDAIVVGVSFVYSWVVQYTLKGSWADKYKFYVNSAPCEAHC